MRYTPDVERERAVAIYDLVADNHFRLESGADGPYALHLSVRDNRLVLDVRDEAGQAVSELRVPLIPLRKTIKDYFMVCDSYYEAIRTATPSQIEAIDVGRRSLHNEGSEHLRRQLAGEVEIDEATARRLFTLVCVLHIRG